MDTSAQVAPHRMQDLRVASAERAQLLDAIAAILDEGVYVNGACVTQLERQLATYCGTMGAVACSSGTSALVLGLLGLGVVPGDEVLVPAISFAATAGAVAMVGAVPRFVEIADDTLCMSPAALVQHIESTVTDRVVGVIAVDLFGNVCDYESLLALTRPRGWWLLADAAQSFGSKRNDRRVGGLADVTALSFFPTKPLGGVSDGGAVVSDSTDLLRSVLARRDHGRAATGRIEVLGTNARMAEIAAAALGPRLGSFATELRRRREVARTYREVLDGCVRIVEPEADVESSWACFTIRHHQRDALRSQLVARGIDTAIYYDTALPDIAPFAGFVHPGARYPLARAACGEVLSLPIGRGIDQQRARVVADAVRSEAAHLAMRPRRATPRRVPS